MNDIVTPEEMQSLEESVGFGPHRNTGRNKIALSGSFFVATARYDDRLVGMIRLVGDGAYVLHVAGLSVYPDFQGKGIGTKLISMAVDFAREIQVGTGDNRGELTLFANIGADKFYESCGFMLTPNGMVFADKESRIKEELQFQEQWKKRRERG